MNAIQIAGARSRLLEERERIITELASHGAGSGMDAGWDLRNPEERATQITSATVDQRIAEDDLNLLKKVELALKRIDDGAYCNCAACGRPIATERLLAKPSVSLCLTCQEEKDAAK